MVGGVGVRWSVLHGMILSGSLLTLFTTWGAGMYRDSACVAAPAKNMKFNDEIRQHNENNNDIEIIL